MSAVRILLALLSLMQISGTSPSAASAAPDELKVYVVTFGPGDAPWEKFGHNMLVIEGSAGGIAYNWGMFDFAQKNFVWHFIQGKLWYWMEGMDYQRVLDAYLADDRTVWVQELNLAPAQKQLLWDYARRNELPENRFYKYDYFVDNCSTRVRDAVDAALGQQLRQKATTMPSDLTLRSETNRLTSGEWWLYTALDFILGEPTDEKMSAWDEMFIPMRMRARINEITVRDPSSGREVPLVKSERVLNVSKRGALPERPPMRWPWFLGVGIVIAAVVMFGSAAAIRGNRLGKWSFLMAGFAWLLLSAFASWFLIYAWTLTDHVWVRRNENLLQLSPLALPMMVVLVLLLWKRTERMGKWALILGVAMAGLSVLGLLLKVLPGVDQVNWNIIALALPANAGMAWAVWKFGRALPQTRKGVAE
ncbi:MAG TPA: DUF4105 domain-containing protein [Tepidisphaeraceae bacterium]|jgi:hypothetical protein